jgi:hypothetical protein
LSRRLDPRNGFPQPLFGLMASGSPQDNRKAPASEARAGESENNHQARLQAWPRSRMGRQHEGGYAARSRKVRE